MVNPHDRGVSGRFPTSRGAWAVLLLAGIGVLISACAGPPPSRPPGDSGTVAAANARLLLPLQTLPKEGQFRRYASADGRYREETAQWGENPYREAVAGIVLSQASPGPPLTDPSSPEAGIPLWPDLRDKRPALTKTVDSRNALGPVQWRRAGIGTSACVLFLQRWPAGGPSAPDGLPSTLSGYYCNRPGVTLSPGAAETVVRSIGLRSPPQRQ